MICRYISLPLILGVVAFPALVSGAPLNLVQRPPDITAGFITTQYTAASGEFSASGFSLAYDLDGLPPPEHPISGTRPFEIALTLDPFNGSPISGTLFVGGEVAGLGATSPLLEGTIREFGFLDTGGEIFEFAFDVSGGSLAAEFGPRAFVMLDAGDTGFAGSFQNDFSSSVAAGVADTFVPEPNSILLAAGGCLALFFSTRRRFEVARCFD